MNKILTLQDGFMNENTHSDEEEGNFMKENTLEMEGDNINDKYSVHKNSKSSFTKKESYDGTSERDFQMHQNISEIETNDRLLFDSNGITDQRKVDDSSSGIEDLADQNILKGHTEMDFLSPRSDRKETSSVHFDEQIEEYYDDMIKDSFEGILIVIECTYHITKLPKAEGIFINK